ncbi:hypothetical protein IKG68_00170 [Candidatus Saccharibacteria bacterium]|nr:hypothetical protein [Candidatus Saccharibacteria bacterium]
MSDKSVITEVAKTTPSSEESERPMSDEEILEEALREEEWVPGEEKEACSE